MKFETCEQGQLKYGKFIRRIIDLDKAGDKVLGHRHMQDHITKISAGSVFLRAYEVGALDPVIEGKFVAPAEIYIKKEWVHEFESLEDGTVAECLFDWQGDLAETAPIL